MSLVEGEERVTIPSMSWSSVVADDTDQVAGESATDATTEPDSMSDTTDASVSFQMTPLVDEPAAEPAPVSTPTPPPPPISFTMGVPAEADESMSTVPPAADVVHDTDATVPVVRPNTSVIDPAPVSLSIPSVSAAPSTPSNHEPLATVELEPVELPPIVEATPPESVTQAVAALHVEPTAEAVQAPPIPPVAPAPVAQPAPVAEPTRIAQPAPVSQPEPVAAAPTQPSQAAFSLPRATVAPAIRVTPPEVRHAPGASRPKKDRSTAIARFGFFLLFIAAVVSAGIIFGRPYLFPPEWEANALPYAEAVEEARGAEFVEPVRVIAQSNAAHRDLVSQQLLGDAQQRMPIWRALGLAGPDATDDASLRDLTSVQSPVLYATSDGQVYYDQSFNQAHRDRLITQAMATAALDQDVSFSFDAEQRGLDANALTDAHVLQQVAQIGALASTTSVPVPEPDVAALAFLPPVLDYRLTAPLVLSAVLPPVNDLAPNPLEGIGDAGPAAARNSSLGVMSATSTVVGDVPVGETVPMDRGFWYLVFAGHLDATTAYDMSNMLERASLQTVQSADGRTCAVATFATANGAENERLGVSLTTWTANVAPELGASVNTLPDATVQLRSCDPAGVFTSNARFGVGRELIGWRATETVVADMLVAEGADAEIVTRALAQIAATPSVQNLISLPAGTPPFEVAAAVRAAAADVVAATCNASAADTSAGG